MLCRASGLHAIGGNRILSDMHKRLKILAVPCKIGGEQLERGAAAGIHPCNVYDSGVSSVAVRYSNTSGEVECRKSKRSK